MAQMMMSNGERATQHSLAGNHAANGNLEVAERRMAIESLANDWKDGETSEAVTRDRRGRLHVSGHTLSPTRSVTGRVQGPYGQWAPARASTLIYILPTAFILDFFTSLFSSTSYRLIFLVLVFSSLHVPHSFRDLCTSHRRDCSSRACSGVDASPQHSWSLCC